MSKYLEIKKIGFKKYKRSVGFFKNNNVGYKVYKPYIDLEVTMYENGKIYYTQRLEHIVTELSREEMKKELNMKKLLKTKLGRTMYEK